MRGLKLIVLTGLILAIAAPAWAGSIGSDPPFSGDLFMHMVNLDASRLYSGFLANGTTPATLGVWYNDPTNQLEWSDKGLLEDNETAFGVFRIDEVYAGKRVGTCNIMKVDPPALLWHDGDGGKEIVGIFYGRQDDFVRFSDPAPLGGSPPMLWEQDIYASGDEYKIWYQDSGTFNDGVNGMADRFGTDQFYTIGYDTIGNPIGELVLTGNSKLCCGLSWEIDVAFNPVNLEGDFNTLVEFDTGVPWNETDGPGDTDFLKSFPFMPGDGGCAHMWLHTTTHAQYVLPDWDMTSSDPLTASVFIPEPLTMLGVFLGVSGLGAYIRRRRRA